MDRERAPSRQEAEKAQPRTEVKCWCVSRIAIRREFFLSA